MAYDIQETTDGGFIVAGGSDYNSWIIKLNNNGEMLWNKFIENAGRARSVQQTTDGGYIVVSGAGSYFVVKLAPDLGSDNAPNIQWQKSFGGTDNDTANSVQQTLDGGYIVVGTSNSSDGDVSVNYGYQDYWVLKLDPYGNKKWEKSLGGSNSEVAQSVKQTLDGGYVIAGYKFVYEGGISGENDYWIVKLKAETENNTPPEIEWEISLGGSSHDMAYDIQITSDGGYVVAGSSKSSDEDLEGNNGYDDYWIVKLDFVTTIEDIVFVNKIAISPNPTLDIIYIDVKGIDDVAITVNDQLGRKILSKNPEVSDVISLDLSELASATYFIIIEGKAIDGKPVRIVKRVIKL